MPSAPTFPPLTLQLFLDFPVKTHLNSGSIQSNPEGRLDYYKSKKNHFLILEHDPVKQVPAEKIHPGDFSCWQALFCGWSCFQFMSPGLSSIRELRPAPSSKVPLVQPTSLDLL